MQLLSCTGLRSGAATGDSSNKAGDLSLGAHIQQLAYKTLGVTGSLCDSQQCSSRTHFLT